MAAVYHELKGVLKQRTKYRSIKTTVDGITFDSGVEARRWCELQILERSGHISCLQRQPKYDIWVNGKAICKVIPDFRYCENGKTVVEDVKSPVTAKNPTYRIKVKLFEALYPKIEFRERGAHKRKRKAKA